MEVKGPKRPLRAFFSDYRRAPEAQQDGLIISFVPADCKAGIVGERLLIQVQCRHCGTVFYVCRRCWRGQFYCEARCRRLSRRQSHRKAQSRYRRTERGRENHRQAERRRRMKKNEKTVDDQGTTHRLGRANRYPTWLVNGFRCRFCGLPGLVVSSFPRRGYG